MATTVDMTRKVIAMTAVQEIADLELATHGDHCLFINLQPIIHRVIDATEARHADLLAVAKRFVELYDDVRGSVGPSVRAAIEHAEQAIAKAEGGSR
jgi:hypothetical protein